MWPHPCQNVDKVECAEMTKGCASYVSRIFISAQDVIVIKLGSICVNAPTLRPASVTEVELVDEVLVLDAVRPRCLEL